MQRSPEIEDLVAQWFDAATHGDDSLVGALVSSDTGTCVIGSDPGEWLRGADVAEFLRGEVAGAAGQARFSTEGTEAYEEGTVAWVTTRLTITLADGRHISPRWSSVLHREGDGWRFVQTHASIGVDNEAVGWVYPDQGRD